jgi:membrane protease YdiL (CAAX protease family)
MAPRRVLLVALGTQTGLILVSWWCARAFAMPPHWGVGGRDAAIGLGAAVALAAANHYLLMRAPANWVVDGVRAVFHDTIVPLFGSLHPLGAVLIGAAAGLGEEWFFRGILQPIAGLAIASVVFGFAHVGSARMLPFGVWATGMGVVMGALALATGGLLAPIVAHGVYDMLALHYIRRLSTRWHLPVEPGAHIQ